jgi:hypothetical protein
MNARRFLAFVLLVSLAIASGPSIAHTSVTPPPATARLETFAHREEASGANGRTQYCPARAGWAAL